MFPKKLEGIKRPLLGLFVILTMVGGFATTRVPFLHPQALGATGVVFGDIGTSGLYTWSAILNAGLVKTSQDVIGITSMIFWTMIMVITLKYQGYLMKLNDNGEGGSQALANQLLRKKTGPVAIGVTIVSMLCVALFLGDAGITAPISFLGAFEGLAEFNPSFKPLILPFAFGAMAALFLIIQPRGTNKICKIFAPNMLVWFILIGLLGVVGITLYPRILLAINPVEIIGFLSRHTFHENAITWGLVGLVSTGGEALFADLSHFSEFGIKRAWYWLVKPALLLNYFGQGAWIMTQFEPGRTEWANPFYALVPQVVMLPMVFFAALVTGIASQAMITGVGTLVTQLIRAHKLPPMKIVYTDPHNHGRVYVPLANKIMFAMSTGIMFYFGSTHRMTDIYGLSVIGNAVLTTFLAYLVLTMVHQKKWFRALFTIAASATFEAALLVGQFVKVGSSEGIGAIFTIAVASTFMAIMGGYSFYYWLSTRQTVALPVRRSLGQLAMLGASHDVEPTHEVEDTSTSETQEE